MCYRASLKGKMAPQLESPVELKEGVAGRTDICLAEGIKTGIMHLDVVAAAPIQANTPSEPMTREQDEVGGSENSEEGEGN